MRLVPILMSSLTLMPGQAMADTIAIVVRVQVPVVCQSGADRQAACNVRTFPASTDVVLPRTTKADGTVVVRTIAP